MHTNKEIRRARLLELESEFGDLEKLAELANVNGQNLKHLKYRVKDSKTGTVRGMSDALARKLEKVTGKERGWMDIDPAVANGLENVEPGPDARGLVPLISWVRAGMWDAAVDPLQPGEAEAWYGCVRPHSESTYALRVRGDSMTSPTDPRASYFDGTIIFVDPERRAPVNGAPIIAKLEGTEEVTFKLFMQEAGRVWLRPLNPQYPLITEPFKILGTVIGNWRDS